MYELIVSETGRSGKGGKKMRRRQVFTVLLLMLTVLCMTAGPALAADTSEHFRVDSSEYREVSPGNMRFLTGEPGENYKFRKMSTRYGYPDDYTPNTTGFSTLNISGSSQYSEGQFRWMARKIRELAPGKEVYIIDLRQESHGFFDDANNADWHGIALSWQGEHNWANMGKSTREVLEDERSRFDATIGKEITVTGSIGSGNGGWGGGSFPTDGGSFDGFTRGDSIPDGATPNGPRDGGRRERTTTLKVKAWRSEKELAESEGFHYLRLAIPDRTFPEEEQIDAFIRLVRSLDMNNSWLHFHCMAGLGRTGIMMSFYDMMKNPNVPLRDILARQTMTGGSYPLSPASREGYMAKYDEERLRLVPLLYEYVQENYKTNFRLPWSKWLALREKQEQGQAGEAVPVTDPAAEVAKVPKTGDTLDPALCLLLLLVGLSAFFGLKKHYSR